MCEVNQTIIDAVDYVDPFVNQYRELVLGSNDRLCAMVDYGDWQKAFKVTAQESMEFDYSQEKCFAQIFELQPILRILNKCEPNLNEMLREEQLCSIVDFIPIFNTDPYIKEKLWNLRYLHQVNKVGIIQQTFDTFISLNVALAIDLVAEKRFFDFTELTNEALSWLVYCVANYNYRLGYKFSTYATSILKGRLLKYYNNNRTLISLKRDVSMEQNQIRSAIKNGRSPSNVVGLAEATGMKEDQIRHHQMLMQDIIEWDDNDLSMGNQGDLLTDLMDRSDSQILEAISGLDDESKARIYLKYGIKGPDNISLEYLKLVQSSSRTVLYKIDCRIRAAFAKSLGLTYNMPSNELGIIENEAFLDDLLNKNSLERLLDEMDPIERTAIILHFDPFRTGRRNVSREVGEHLGMTRQAADNRIKKGMKHLKKLAENDLQTVS